MSKHPPTTAARESIAVRPQTRAIVRMMAALDHSSPADVVDGLLAAHLAMRPDLATFVESIRARSAAPAKTAKPNPVVQEDSSDDLLQAAGLDCAEAE